MANKKSEDLLTTIFMFLCVAALIIIAIIYLAAIITPIIILVLFFVNLFRYRSNDKHWKQYGFWLTPSEKVHFKQSYINIMNAQKSQEEVAKTLQTETVAINLNGRISARSYKGKALRAKLESANLTLEESAKIYDELRTAPQQRWKRAKKHYSMAVGWGSAFIPWGVLFLALTFNIGGGNDPTFSANALGAVADTLQIDSSTVYDMIPEIKEDTDSLHTSTPEATGLATVLAYGTVAIPIAIGSLAVWLIAWIIGLIVFVCKNRKPPIVDLENIDTYCLKPKSKQTTEKDSKTVTKGYSSDKDANNSENKNSSNIQVWNHNGWLPVLCSDGQDGIILSNDQGNPGKAGICLQNEGHYCFIAEYLEDSDFSEALKEKMGGEQSNGKWRNPISEPYYSKIIAGEFRGNFDNDKEFQDYVVLYLEQLTKILERQHRTYTWKQKIGNHNGWKVFIWQWDILACEHLSPNEGKLFIDTSLDSSSGNIIILMGNRQNDRNLLRSTLQRLGCPDRSIENNGRVVLETFQYTTADSVTERILYWIEKIEK